MTWRSVALRDCMKLSSGGTPNKGKPEYWVGDIPWVSSGEMSRSFINDTSLHISEAGAATGSRLVPAGTIFAVVRGMSLATEFRVSYATRQVAFNQDLKALAAKEGVDPYFLFSSLRAHASDIRDLATEAAHGTKKLETERLESFQIKIPDLKTQCRVAALIKAYDDLIENNQRRIKLLEEAARRLYREWFIALRFPGHERVQVADGVPQGWSRRTFGDVCDAAGGATPSTARADFWNGDLTWLTPTDVTRNKCLYLAGSSRKITSSGLESCSAQLLPAGTIFMTSRASIGYFAILDHAACTNQGFISIVPTTTHSREFLLFHLMSRVPEFISRSTGSTFLELSKKTFRAMECIWPTDKVLEQYSCQVGPILKQIEALKKQLDAAGQARDALLPRLMSGALEV